ncbi:MAG: glycosyltransferase family 4 protein [Thermoplasmata archaeon]
MIRLCISTQSPPTQPLGTRHATARHVWRLGTDYEPQFGGVVPMMRALLRHGINHWIAPNPRWVALGAGGLPREFRTNEGYWVETVDFDPKLRPGYVRFKEAIWRSFHGPRGLEPMAPADYRAFVGFNHAMAQRLLERAGQYDLLYVNDFQQLLVGGLIGAMAPTLLRWHIPLEFRGYPEPVRRFFLRSMEGFDAVVVSTRRGLEELLRVGLHGRAFQVYPYIDPAEHEPTSESMRLAFQTKFGLEGKPYLLAVGRLDPVKRQDLVIRAFSSLRRRYPELRLVLAGGLSFSTAHLARRGENKAADWDTTLHREIRRLRLEKSVVLTGNLSHDELRAAYDGARVFVHPAPWEGFGLVAIEAWTHGIPVVVSRGAGVAELVDDGVNGMLARPGSVPSLTAQIDVLLRHPDAAERMGIMGRLAARRCHIEQAMPRLREIFSRTMQLYTGAGRTSSGRT